jgi:hypothetical protein
MTKYFYHQKWFPNFDGCCHYWPDSHIYGAVSIDDDNKYHDMNDCSRKDMIIRWTSTRWWLHSLCYWYIWLSSFLFWFIFDCLCIDYYCVSSMIFFSSFDVFILLSTMRVHNLATCISHGDFSIGYDTWSKFFISSTHHSQCTSVTSYFVADDNFFVLDILCYRWLSFHNHGSYLHRVFTLLL